MKNLITTAAGGFPFTLDRLRWMDEGHKEALKALCQSLLPPGATSMILQGCEITTSATPDLYNVSAGWIYLETDLFKEICQVDAHSFTTGAGLGFQYSFWDNDYDYPNGSVIFFDGSTKQVDQLIKAKIYDGQVNQGCPLVSDVPAINGTWVKPNITGSYDGDIYYKVNRFGLAIKGTIAGPSGNLFMLPVNARPSVTTRIALTSTISTYENTHFVINTSGQVSYDHNSNGPTYNTYYINTIVNL
jgi:hypothetical protein